MHLYVPKKLSETRWSCRADATRAFTLGYSLIKDALIGITEDDDDEKTIVRSQAEGLCNRMSTLETGLYSVFWYDILERFNATCKILQDPQLDILTAVASMKSLGSFVRSKRDCFDEYERRGMEITGISSYIQATSRIRRRNVRMLSLDYGQAQEASLTPAEKFRTENFLPVIDQLMNSLEQRILAYDIVQQRFGFLRNLVTMTHNDIRKSAAQVVLTYNADLDSTCTENELIQFAELLKSFADEHTNETPPELFMYQLITSRRLSDTFPNVEILLRMYLVLMVANCSSERSFSKLKLIKNRLRTSMSEDRLVGLTLLSTESDILRRELEFNDVINQFAIPKVSV